MPIFNDQNKRHVKKKSQNGRHCMSSIYKKEKIIHSSDRRFLRCGQHYELFIVQWLFLRPSCTRTSDPMHCFRIHKAHGVKLISCTLWRDGSEARRLDVSLPPPDHPLQTDGRRLWSLPMFTETSLGLQRSWACFCGFSLNMININLEIYVNHRKGK